VYQAVDQGQADLGLVSYPEESASLAALAWRSEPMVLVCHPQHAFTGRKNVSLDMLRGESFVAFQVGLKIREEIDRVLGLHKVAVRVALEFDNIETIKRAIEIGSGVSLLPEPTVAREIESGALVQIAVEGQPIVRPLGIIHRRDRELSATARQFIKLLQSEAPAATIVEATTEDVETNGHAGRRTRKKSKVVQAFEPGVTRERMSGWKA
jgi:DNA-binding transcriptional LysR family regulator